MSGKMSVGVREQHNRRQQYDDERHHDERVRPGEC